MVDQLTVNIPLLPGFIFGGLGMQEMVIVAVVAVLLFGKNLPNVARTFGRHYNEFKKSLGEISSEFKNATKDIETTISDTNNEISQSFTSSYDDYDDFEEASAPKFEPPPSEPIEDNSSTS